ncbi:hypothetical protein Pmani_029560 [Petrolisthes manimaculis]|uniref:ADAMTS/ADAMTS-like cysteine-rich domain-containing protein n=1 Tax=Petrolisthes manimaculis TaxID=1843537 RepID=A0AAE1NYH2_9EUCA|nr:hypothetical protein Pmani_029560 [Petrolisthes manimaculis]
MEWSSWGSWARCSRSCGGGVKSRSRTCVTSYPRVMPGSGVRTSHDQCRGESVEYHVCGASPCPPSQVSALSFRAAQCRHYNNKRVFGRVVNNWVPYTQGGINPCALVCEGEGQGLVYTFGKVTDGTHCSSGGRDGLCVNGRCMPLSCDGRLGGRAREDMCRICGGNNDTCTHHVGIFHTDLPAADQPPTHPTTPPTTTTTPPDYHTNIYPDATPTNTSTTTTTTTTTTTAATSTTNVVNNSGDSNPQQATPSPIVTVALNSNGPHVLMTNFPSHPQSPKPRSLGYYEVTNIPRGATNVRVKDASANFLVSSIEESIKLFPSATLLLFQCCFLASPTTYP